MERHFGICEWALPVSGLLAIRLAAEAGYEGIQLGELGGRGNGCPLNHPRVQTAYREEADRWGLKLHSLNLGALLAEGTMDHPPGSVRGQWARKSLEKGFAACRALGAGTVVITVDPKTDAAFENVLAHLAFARELAEESGIEIALESGLPLGRFLELLDRAGEGFRVCMDILNSLRFGTGDPREEIRLLGGERIAHFHLKDSAAALFRRGQRGCVPLGQGDGGFWETAEHIRALEFSGWLITENYYYLPPMNGGGKDFLALAAADLETMRRAFPGEK
ncbi:sugar phosphate isomerase/epimerase family protein [Oscillibacter sp.]|uniref:sugar phosphate isomerase/epimerase family protein n=1 Tax=Oscillibacter sp. TaxID=1945593 RepID=UPI002D7F9E42|nr:sugar phosphate isomerase/epimerase family protein [Oscillibacter sp.]